MIHPILAFTPFDPWHMLVLLAVALLLFGKRLPEVGRSLGKGISEFKKGLRDVQDELRQDDTRDQRRLPPDRDPATRPYDDRERERQHEPRERESSGDRQGPA